MNIRGIYHTSPSHFKLVKELNFSHANLMLWNFPSAAKAVEAYYQAHDLGLHTIISGKFMNEFLEELTMPCSQCLLSTHDEPNLKGTPASTIKNLRIIYNQQGWRTLCVLSWIRSYKGYENCADYIGFDYYKDLNFWRELKLTMRIHWFNRPNGGNKSPIVAVPAVKPGKICYQFSFWSTLTDNFFWYQMHPQQEDPPWHNRGVDQDPALQEELKNL